LTNFNIIGLEMEGLNYMKAIQKTMLLEGVKPEVYAAYYSSDNPLDSSTSLASGSLGKLGFKPC